MQLLQTDLLERPMSRAEFLKHLGVGVFVLSGGGALLQLFQGVSKTRLSSTNNFYGIRSYGGVKRTS